MIKNNCIFVRNKGYEFLFTFLKAFGLRLIRFNFWLGNPQRNLRIFFL